MMSCAGLWSPAAWEVPGCPRCAYLEGAAVAFGLIGMAQAINAFVAQREFERIQSELAQVMARAGLATPSGEIRVYRHPRPRECGHCQGTGDCPECRQTGHRACSDCGGTGRLPR